MISGPLGTDFLLHGQGGGILPVKRVVLAGHGSFNTVTDAKFPKVRLPANVTIWFWCLHGEALDDTVGAYIESHSDINQLPEAMMQREEWREQHCHRRDRPGWIRGLELSADLPVRPEPRQQARLGSVVGLQPGDGAEHREHAGRHRR